MSRPATEHYGIVEYGPRGTEDPMDVYDVYNQAMVTIDSILFEHEQQIGKLWQAIRDLDAKVEDYNTKLNKRIDDLDTKVEEYNTAINKRVTDLDTKVENYKTQTDQKFTQVNQSITNLGNKTDSLWASIREIVSKTQGGGSVNTSTGHITWGDTTGKIALGTINVNSGTGYIRTHDGTQDNDVKVV